MSKWLVAALALVLGLIVGGAGALCAVWVKEDRAYPWELHRQINTPALEDCAFLGKPKIGESFWVEPAAGGKGVRLVTYNAQTKMVAVSVVGPDHADAYDTWEIPCQ